MKTALMMICGLVLLSGLPGCGSGDKEGSSAAMSSKSSLSRSDKIIQEYIDSELAPRLRRKGATSIEINEMKTKLLGQFQRVEESRRVEAAKYAIHEMIRMNGL